MTIDAETIREYRKLRQPDYAHYVHGWQSPAHIALRNAQTRVRFGRLGAVCYDDQDARWTDSDHNEVRLRIVPDYDGGMFALDFDCCDGMDNAGARWQHCACWRVREYAQDYQDNRGAQRLCEYGQPCRHKCDEARRIERDGVYGVVAEYRDADLGWTEADSCWGFIGNDWRDGCEDRLMAAAIHALIV